ncbi:MAG: hypothetical protein IKX85_04455, partial [Clostridia bacterium]|nr:hypothetical protein [Clostridia bacterium]
GRSGAIYDSVNFDDLALADPERYKAVLFIHVPYLTKARREMIGRFKSGGRHLLWINTSGYLNETGAGAENISEVCGIRVKECGAPSAMDIRYRGILRRIAPPDPYSLRFTPEGGAGVVGTFASSDIPAAAKKEEEGYTSWYFSLFPSDTDILREIFRSAGVHIYSENGEAILAGNGIVVVSTESEKDAVITLPNGIVIREFLPAMTTAVYDETTGRRLDREED